MKRLLLRMIGFYQRRISPAFGAHWTYMPA